jgi:hypothetical protein
MKRSLPFSLASRNAATAPSSLKMESGSSMRMIS